MLSRHPALAAALLSTLMGATSLGACESDKKAADVTAAATPEPVVPTTPSGLAESLRAALASGATVDALLTSAEEEARGCPKRWEGDKGEAARKRLGGEVERTVRQLAQCRTLGDWTTAKLVSVSGGTPTKVQTCRGGTLKELHTIQAVYSLPKRLVRMTFNRPRQVAGGALKLAAAPKCHDDSALDRACATIERLMQKDGAECRMMLRGSVKDDAKALACIAESETKADIARCSPRRPR